MTDDVYIADRCVRGRLYGIGVCGSDSNDLQLDGRAAAVVDGQNGVLDIDVIDSYDNANYADVSDRVVEVKVYLLPYIG